MCCNWTLDQKHPKKEKILAESQQCIQHLTPGWEWYHQPFNVEISTTSFYTKNNKIPLKEILLFFSQIHEMTSPTVWNHPSDLIGFAQSKQLSYDSCDSCLMIAITTFPNSWDNLFRTAVTTDLAAWPLLIFSHLAKIKTNYWNHLSLAEILSFSATLSLTTLTRNSKNNLNLNIQFLAKS